MQWFRPLSNKRKPRDKLNHPTSNVSQSNSQEGKSAFILIYLFASIFLKASKRNKKYDKRKGELKVKFSSTAALSLDYFSFINATGWEGTCWPQVQTIVWLVVRQIQSFKLKHLNICPTAFQVFLLIDFILLFFSYKRFCPSQAVQCFF